MDEQDEALKMRAQARLGSTLREKYRLDRVLGIGGMATVFAATHRNQAELAVKVLHPELSLRDDLKKRFLREGYVGNSVKHPGAVLVMDDDVAEDGAAFLVMELLRGLSLEQLWEREGGRLPSNVVAALGIQLLEVLAAAHEKAIVHRDLKPANLFLTVDGTLKVLDFGIARLRDAVGGSEHATRTGTLMGTPAFMAPEQAQAIATEIDGQTDLWAVGATLYTLLSGQLVHDGDNSSQLLIRAGTSRARPLMTVAPNIERPIAEVVDRALAFEKSGRWPNADAMRDALVAASTAVFGKEPGRDVLTSLVASELRGPRRDSLHAAGSGSSMGSGASERVVISGQENVHPNGPTFATPVLPGLSTGHPVSAEPATLPSQDLGVRRSTVITGAAAALALVVVAFTLSTRPPKVDATIKVTGSQPSAALPTNLPAALPPLPALSAVPSTPTPLPAPPPVVSASSAPAALPLPAPTATAKSTKSVAPTGGSKPAAAATVDCSTPYTLDANGQKKWKLECNMN